MSLTVITLNNSQMTNASAIQNLSKNIAGAVGTSLVSTMVTIGAQVHQYMLVGDMTTLNPNFTARGQALAANFAHYHEQVAQNMTQALLYKELIIQSTLFAYIDTFRIFGILCFFIVPLLVFINIKKRIND